MTPAQDQLLAAHYEAYLDALRRGERLRCRAIADELRAGGVGVRALYERLFRRSLYDIGTLWEQNAIGVATEHVATAITEGLMNRCFEEIASTDRVGRSVVIASVAGELHQVGARMVADIFELHGWDSHFVGADTPSKELARLVAEVEPDVVGLSLSLYFNLGAMLDQLALLAENHPRVQLICGGRAISPDHEPLLRERAPVRVLYDLAAVDAFAAESGPRVDDDPGAHRH